MAELTRGKQFVYNWSQWNEMSGDVFSAGHKEDLLEEWAAKLGIPTHTLHDRVTGYRKQGMSTREAIKAACTSED